MAVGLGFGSIYQRYYAFVTRALRRQQVSAADLDDMVHEVFIVLLRKLGPEVDEQVLRPWLFEVARRVAANHRRGQRRHERKRTMRISPPTAPTPEDRAAVRERMDRVVQFVEDLDDSQREVFRLTQIEGEPGRVVAAELGIKLHAAYSRMNSLRADFRRAMQEHDEKESAWALVFPWLGRPVTAAAAATAGLVAAAIIVFFVLADATEQRKNTSTGLDRLANATPVGFSTPEPELPIIILDSEPAEPEVIILDEPDGLATPENPRLNGTRRRPNARLLDVGSTLVADRSPNVVALEPSVGPPKPPAIVAAASFGAGPVPAIPMVPTPKPRAVEPSPAPNAWQYWEGRLVDEYGRPLQNAKVLCRRRTDGLRRRCFSRRSGAPRTDSKGRVRLGPLAAGTYELVALPDGARTTGADAIIVAISPPT